MAAEPILRDVTPEQLGMAVEQNLFALFRAMTDLPGGELDDREMLGRHFAPPTNPMFKGAWNTHTDPDDTDVLIDETIAWFREREAPFFFWWTGPATMPRDLGARLEARGFVSMEEQAQEMAPGIRMSARGSPGMVADLASMDEDVLEQVPTGFEVAQVRSAEDLEAFRDVIVTAMEIPPPMANGWVQAAETVGIDDLPWRMYLGRLDGAPVATNMLFNGAGVASVYGVATVPEARGKGIGSAITLGPLLEAREEGYEHAVLFSTLMAAGVYRRIGFRDCDVWLDRYLWRAP